MSRSDALPARLLRVPAMTESPILFSGPMVKAILADRKSQTRRVVKLPGWAQPCNEDHDFELDSTPEWPHAIARKTGCLAPLDCPYGAPGDRLWVRETWKYADWTEDGYPFIGYRADDARVLKEEYPEEWVDRLTDTWATLSLPENYDIDNRAADRRWRPGIHMPRWACRLVVEVTAVRVERLQAISEDDAQAEGVERKRYMVNPFKTGALRARFSGEESSHAEAYALLWDSINGKRAPWASNPWVWVVEFRRIP